MSNTEHRNSEGVGVRSNLYTVQLLIRVNRPDYSVRPYLKPIQKPNFSYQEQLYICQRVILKFGTRAKILQLPSALSLTLGWADLT